MSAPMQPVTADRKPVKRARYVDGIQLPRVADGRSQFSKRFRKLVESFIAELGGNPSPEDAALIRQTAHLVLTGEQMQAASINGERVDVDALIRINSETRRNLGMIKAKGANKPAGPDLASYLASKYPAKASAEPADADDEPEALDP
jgi:hypothetical protein